MCVILDEKELKFRESKNKIKILIRKINLWQSKKKKAKGNENFG